MGSVSMGNGDIIGILDLTLLDRGASEEELIRLCERAVAHRVAAVCVFSEHVRFVRGLLPEEVKVASVVGGFPVGWRDPTKVSTSREGTRTWNRRKRTGPGNVTRGTREETHLMQDGRQT